ncbi:MAG: hypothetical protein QM758_10580 [Armatimonas sp.]
MKVKVHHAKDSWNADVSTRCEVVAGLDTDLIGSSFKHSDEEAPKRQAPPRKKKH